MSTIQHLVFYIVNDLVHPVRAVVVVSTARHHLQERVPSAMTAAVFVPAASKAQCTVTTLRCLGFVHIMASGERCPRSMLSTPGTSSYRLSYKRALGVVSPQTHQMGYLLIEAMTYTWRGFALRMHGRPAAFQTHMWLIILYTTVLVYFYFCRLHSKQHH